MKTLDDMLASKMMVTTCSGLRLTSEEPAKMSEKALTTSTNDHGYSQDGPATELGQLYLFILLTKSKEDLRL